MPRQIDLTTHINKMGRWTNKENAYETNNNKRLQIIDVAKVRRVKKIALRDSGGKEENDQ